MDHPDPWPLRDLVLRTPRLELRPDDDDGLRELVEVAHAGVHDPAVMPFLEPWTDADPRYLGRGILQYHWAQRAQVDPRAWGLHFLVRHEGRVLGVQSLTGRDFPALRTVGTGSWLGRTHQGGGFGTEMRAAVLGFAFDHLGAVEAVSGAFADNAASLRVSEKLGYRRNGTCRHARRGEPATEVLLRLEPADFVRPDWTLRVEGLDACRGLLGAG
ncbi:GNAT family N-acetyltransferase [Pseudonocardia humida]|uniref:GNAT family N-acetyltransferase n=1 Tax=Pseudonocardia humida TaxID=2800819 RepID=A0ABT1A4E6_9PSEU|nr:GNAT family N-acetyltransferase [Pseudonocardia humida]MCO1657880.1 GNAT family N-acetyltransferase [Pseudonocardia humida]